MELVNQSGYESDDVDFDVDDASRKRSKLLSSVVVVAAGVLMTLATIPMEPPRIGN